MSLKIHLIDKVPEEKIDHQQIKKRVKSFLEKFHLDHPLDRIHMDSREEIKRINRDYRQKDKSTDVISFPIDQPLVKGKREGEITILGDIFLAPEMVRDDLNEVIRHGLVHLLGLDHKTEKEEREFKKLCSTND